MSEISELIDKIRFSTMGMNKRGVREAIASGLSAYGEVSRTNAMNRATDAQLAAARMAEAGAQNRYQQDLDRGLQKYMIERSDMFKMRQPWRGEAPGSYDRAPYGIVAKPLETGPPLSEPSPDELEYHPLAANSFGRPDMIKKSGEAYRALVPETTVEKFTAGPTGEGLNPFTAMGKALSSRKQRSIPQAPAFPDINNVTENNIPYQLTEPPPEQKRSVGDFFKDTSTSILEKLRKTLLDNLDIRKMLGGLGTK